MSKTKRQLKDFLPYSRSMSEWANPHWSRRFSWVAFAGVIATLAIAFFGDFLYIGDISFHVAMFICAVVALLLVAPALFRGNSSSRSTHPDADIRDLANGDIDIEGYRKRKEVKDGESAG